jgi:Predicted regulator of amino acid metabolism, contains ACT domain
VSSEFDRILEEFDGSPGQQAVVRLLLERGFSINEEGSVVSGGIEIPDARIAREADVDRRVVNATTEALLDDEEFAQIFRNITTIPSLMDLAPVLGFTVVTVTVGEPEASGIIAEITSLLADSSIPLRQVLSDDPEFAENPKLYLITDEPVPPGLLVDIRELPYVRGVEF